MIHLLLAVIYMAFISLGLPDSLLGSAWPTMYPEFGVPVSYAGAIAMVISFGTVVSSLQSDRLTRKLGTGKVTTISVAMTAFALFGFSVTHSFWLLLLWAIPYGLGAGSIDAALNNYVALHYSSHHMSWLHCMWGIGASVGPYIMGYALSDGLGWNMGYRYIALIQIVLTVILMLSLPLWKKRGQEGLTEEGEEGSISDKPLSLGEICRLPGAKEVLVAFFCYCAIEQTTGLWASSYLVLYRGMSTELAAKWAAWFFLGITIGRAFGGFLMMKWNDTTMIRGGQCLVLVGILFLLCSPGGVPTLAGLVLIGLGCAPIYPCIIHSTPKHFGADKSQAIIGVQMASAYVGTTLMPPVFGLIANHISVALLPVYLVILLGWMAVMHERLLHKVTEEGRKKI